MVEARISRLYIETSVYNFYFYGKEQKKQACTLRLFDAIAAGAYEVYTSEYAVRELRRDATAKRQQMLDLIEKYRVPVLPSSDAVEDLAEEYITKGIIPARFVDDAYHIAASAMNGIDFVVSYNYGHIGVIRKLQFPNNFHKETAVL